jgi:hypothetical protein
MVLVCCLLVFLVGTAPAATRALAQTDDPACVTLAQIALTITQQSCGDLQPGQVCYGFPGAAAKFLTPDAAPPFLSPGQRVPLDQVTSIRTNAVDLASSQWGIAAIRFRAAVAGDASTNGLATALMIGDVTMTLNDFSLVVRTAFDQPVCKQTPSAFLLRSGVGGSTTEVPVYINGATALLNGTLVLRWQSANSMNVIIPQGALSVIGGPSAVAGQTLVAIVDNRGMVMTWSAARPINDKEGALLAALSVPIDPQGAASGVTTTANTAPSSGAGGGGCRPGTHVVAAGETLYRIALRYNTTVQAIAAANHLSNPSAIQRGQRLIIPCGTGGGALPASPSTAGAGKSPPPAIPPGGAVPCSSVAASTFSAIASSIASSGLPVPNVQSILSSAPCQ